MQSLSNYTCTCPVGWKGENKNISSKSDREMTFLLKIFQDPIALREIIAQIILAAQTVVAFPPSTVTDVIATKALMDLIAESTLMSAITTLAEMGNV